MRCSLRWALASVIGIVGIGTMALGQPAETSYLDAEDCIEDREALLALDYWAFDQDIAKGVRAIAATPGCELVAADLTRDYHRALRERDEPVIVDHPQGTVRMSENGEMSILYWHEGQIRAFEGQTDQAIGLFRKSLKPEERNYGAWNEYAMGTIAFMENDLAGLKQYRAAMAEKLESANINLGVLDGFIVCFGKSYKEAYGSAECNRRPGFDAKDGGD